ncbi:nucleotide disphospho-sugar-binding domain-containing protein [Streptomyces sp. CoH27]|uniref:nucleotide disphospho-sugar-binding domain-containing protein n=1 Tax=Streptomyces sp. CoH27 TaxID=2875763 RepID=UPI001CD698C2|nr:nucleotide disphospho-sugar-binding domain-containing protein [Streptomyces sp. CoH27]
MRALFTTSDWGGHYYCMVPLGWALQAAGHEVRVACPPGQARAVSDAGLVAMPVLDGPDMTYCTRLIRYQEAVDGTSPLPGPPLHPVTGKPVQDLTEFDVAAETARFWQEAGRSVQRSYDAVVEFAGAWRPDLAVYDMMAPEGALAARLAGVPALYHSAGLFGAAETDPVLETGLEDPTGSFARHGAKPWNRDQIEYVIDPSPRESLPPHGDALRIPVRPVPYNGVRVLPDWLLEPPAGRRVCVLWGYSATAMYGPFVPALRHTLEAAAATGAEVVLTASGEQVAALGELPPGVQVLSDFPVDLLLPTCDAVIHHGGAGTAMNAFTAGVPQLCLTLSIDQPVFRERLTRGGAALALSALTSAPEQIHEAVAALLDDDGLRRSAAQVSAGLAAQPSPAQLVAPLVELARTGRLSPASLPGER